MSNDVNFIFQEDAQRIFNHFTRLLDIRITFFTADGNELATGGHRGLCDYCKLLRTNLDCENTCRIEDKAKQIQALNEEKLISYTCHGGMIEATLPVFNVDKLVGFIMIGQFRTTGKCPEHYRQAWKLANKNDLLYKAFLKTPYYPENKLNDIFGMFELIVDSIVSRHLIAVRTASSVEKLISYIDQNPHINLTLAQAADIMYRSPSSISHEFKRATGVNFKKYLIQKKLDKADELMSGNSRLKVYQVAEKVGYSDPYLFSRIYKKHRGFSPTDSRKT